MREEKGVEHLLIDLPSVDKEKDGGMLVSHRAFWDFKGKIRANATITELIYVNNRIIDGTYLLNLQVAPFENDASPSRPLLFKIEEMHCSIKASSFLHGITMETLGCIF